MKRYVCLMMAALLAAGLCCVPAAATEPLRIEAVIPAAESMEIRWNDTGADRYAVYRATSRWGSYRKLGTTTAATYKDHGLQTGIAYYYRIRACRKNGTEWGRFTAPQGAVCLPILQLPAVQNPCSRQQSRIEVQGLMLHSIGCPQERAAAVAAGMNSGAAQVLVHAVIDPNGTILQLADWDLRCWHCGGAGNSSMIGVEMTEPEELRYLSGACFAWRGDAAETAVKNYDTAVRLFASLCLQYGLDPQIDVCSHGEAGRAGTASGHADPEHLWFGLGLPLTMDTFRADVAAFLAGTYAAKTAEQTGHIVTVTAEQLNIRAGAGTGYAVRGALYRGEKIAVEAVAQSGQHRWGKLANGCWIALTYTSD